MEIDTIEVTTVAGHGGRVATSLICHHYFKPGHRAEICRAPVLVLANAVVSNGDDVIR
ncbi:hypothetical protein PC128_g23668 [Phytophthora cactorum]|nr:hypothetical protein PC128_g23668 [Phytophthora cactorum]